MQDNMSVDIETILSESLNRGLFDVLDVVLC